MLIEAPSTREAVLRNHSVDIMVPGTSCVPATTISFQATNKLHCIASGDEQACYPIHCRVRYGMCISLNGLSVDDVISWRA